MQFMSIDLLNHQLEHKTQLSTVGILGMNANLLFHNNFVLFRKDHLSKAAGPQGDAPSCSTLNIAPSETIRQSKLRAMQIAILLPTREIRHSSIVPRGRLACSMLLPQSSFYVGHVDTKTKDYMLKFC